MGTIRQNGPSFKKVFIFRMVLQEPFFGSRASITNVLQPIDSWIHLIKQCGRAAFELCRWDIFD